MEVSKRAKQTARFDLFNISPTLAWHCQYGSNYRLNGRHSLNRERFHRIYTGSTDASATKNQAPSGTAE